VVTANHFWLDGVVAAVLVIAVLAGQSLVRRLRSGKSSATSQVTPVRKELSVRS